MSNFMFPLHTSCIRKKKTRKEEERMEIQESDNFKAQETQREEPINFFFFFRSRCLPAVPKLTAVDVVRMK